MKQIELEKRLSEIVFCDCNIPLEEDLYIQMRKELERYPEKYWYWCTYRKCYLLLLYGNASITNKDALGWMEHVNLHAPQVKKFVEESLSPYFLNLPRIIVLKTSKKEAIPFHIDCNVEEIGTFNPKLRVCFSGNSGKLQFLKQDGDVITAYPKSKIYYMSGAFTHRLINDSEEERITLCFGAPWKMESARQSFYDALLIEGSNTILKNDIGSVKHNEYAKDWSAHRLVPAVEYEDRTT